MANAVETVNAFLAECGKSEDAMREAFRTYFTPITVWENVGMATTTGVEEALSLLDGFKASMGVVCFNVETVARAVQDERVLTERIDTLLNGAGQTLKALRVMGIFEVQNGKIAAWRDYFDSAGLAG